MSVAPAGPPVGAFAFQERRDFHAPARFGIAGRRRRPQLARVNRPPEPEMTAPELIERLGLVPLPGEGGHYRETWRAGEAVDADALPPRFAGPRAFGTAILYLLSDEADSFSALHRLPTDEVYHFYLGDPVELLELGPAGGSRVVTLGSGLRDGHRVQHVVAADVWQGSRLAPGGRWALLGTTMAPGFELPDYAPGGRADLTRKWPEHTDRIRSLTREAP